MVRLVGVIVGFIALGIAIFLLGVNIIVWNVTDIQANGVNFWNVFWLSLVGLAWFGSGKAVK